MSKTGLVENDFKAAAKLLNCEIATIKAVAEVESKGGGFLDTGEPIILFERHVFSRLTKKAHDKEYPDISNPIPGGYGKYSMQHDKLQKAIKLNREAALKSASWGMFQIMGFNYNLCGFSKLQGFINAMYRAERDHLTAFINFINKSLLGDELRNRKWAEFARKYNGPDYKINKYDEKLAEAYKKHSLGKNAGK